MPKALLLTGASGFVGSRYKQLNSGRYQIKTIRWQDLDNINDDLKNIEVVVHMAALNHRMDAVPDTDYHSSNFDLTKKLGLTAKANGIDHFIFLSTVKVYGESNVEGQPYSEADKCKPVDAYGRSKLDAENALRKMESETFKVSIIRCPLVYGPNVKGNMERLIKLASSSFPLGFKGIDNQRTMVFVDNLISLIDTIIQQERPGTFLAADDEPISTSEAVTLIREAMGKSPNIFAVPGFVISIMGYLIPSLKTRLFDSLVFNNTETKKQLNFQNPYSSNEGFEIMIQGNLNSSK